MKEEDLLHVWLLSEAKTLHAYMPLDSMLGLSKRHGILARKYQREIGMYDHGLPKRAASICGLVAHFCAQ